MDELGATQGLVLSLQAVQGSEQQLRLAVVYLPDVAAGLGVAQVPEDGHAVVSVEDLVLARLVGVRDGARSSRPSPVRAHGAAPRELRKSRSAWTPTSASRMWEWWRSSPRPCTESHRRAVTCWSQPTTRNSRFSRFFSSVATAGR